MEKITRPKTLSEAVDYFLPRFEGMEDYFKLSEDTFAAFCHSQTSGGIGMQMRNELGLWEKKSDIYHHMVEVHKIDHPDDMSDLILRSIYKIKNNIQS